MVQKSLFFGGLASGVGLAGAVEVTIRGRPRRQSTHALAGGDLAEPRNSD